MTVADQAFLECNLDKATEVIIEGQKMQENIFETDAAIVEKPKMISKYNENDFKWKKLYKISQMHEVAYPHAKIKFLFDDTNAIEPTAVFEMTCHFDELVNEIVVQSELHSLHATNR